MNVLILGRNAINAELEKNLAGRGIATMVMPDAAEIVKFKGQPGEYAVTTPAGKYSFTSVIITEAPQFEGITVCGGVSINLMNDDETGELLAGKPPANLKPDEKIVILLDYAEETPEYITAKAIDLAKRLAERKKEVLVLSKVVKSGYGDNELKYREARNAGVTFVKYGKLALGYDEEADRFRAEANDGVFDITIDTPCLVSVTGKETPELKSISKKLRLYNRQDGRINDDRFFLYPAFTTRRGIYYLNPALVMPDKEQSVKQAIPSIIEDMAAIGDSGYIREIIRDCGTGGSALQFPEIDPNKCAFCYSCFRACPHGALEPDLEASAMKVVEPECEACGTCMAICPGEAIKRKAPPAGKGEPAQPAPRDSDEPRGGLPPRRDFAAQPAGRGRCKIYFCENGAAEAFKDALPSLGEYGKTIASERVTCGGSVGTDKLVNDLKNYETVIVACCVEDACRHMEGDRRACKQTLRSAELLRKAGIGNRRVKVIKVSGAMSGVMKDNILSILEGQT